MIFIQYKPNQKNMSIKGWQKYVFNMKEFEKLFDKLSYWSEKYWLIYTAVLIYLEDETRIAEFREFLLKYLRITDSVFDFSKHKTLLILEDTTLRWALNLIEELKNKIKEKWFSFKFYCSAIQWDYIEKEKSLIKALKKRLKIAIHKKKKSCVYDLED